MKTMEFYVGELKTPVRLMLRQEAGEVVFTMSHHIRTPSMPFPYISSCTRRPTEYEARAAADAVLATMQMEYRRAVRAGHQPSESWLVPA